MNTCGAISVIAACPTFKPNPVMPAKTADATIFERNFFIAVHLPLKYLKFPPPLRRKIIFIPKKFFPPLLYRIVKKLQNNFFILSSYSHFFHAVIFSASRTPQNSDDIRFSRKNFSLYFPSEKSVFAPKRTYCCRDRHSRISR